MTSKTSANRIEGQGELATERGQRMPLPQEHVGAIVDRWPTAPKQAAQDLFERYGAPHEATPSKPLWYRVENSARIELTSEEIVHNSRRRTRTTSPNMSTTGSLQKRHPNCWPSMAASS